jgi:hypothetical protein
VVTIARARSFVIGCSVLAVLALSGAGLALLVFSGSSSRAQNPRPAPHVESPRPARRIEPPRPQPHVESPRPAQIDRNGVLILIRTALLALDAANKTGNYSVLRDLGAPGFQEANSDARLAEIFASERRENLDLSGVAVLEPQLSVLPQIEPNGMMRMAGFFPSVPTQVNFELLYAPVNRQWRLMGLAVSLGQTAPVAPAPPAAEPPPPRPEPKAKAKPEARISPRSERPMPLTQAKQ